MKHFRWILHAKCLLLERCLIATVCGDDVYEVGVGELVVERGWKELGMAESRGGRGYDSGGAKIVCDGDGDGGDGAGSGGGGGGGGTGGGGGGRNGPAGDGRDDGDGFDSGDEEEKPEPVKPDPARIKAEHELFQDKWVAHWAKSAATKVYYHHYSVRKGFPNDRGLYGHFRCHHPSLLKKHEVAKQPFWKFDGYYAKTLSAMDLLVPRPGPKYRRNWCILYQKAAYQRQSYGPVSHRSQARHACASDRSIQRFRTIKMA